MKDEIKEINKDMQYIIIDNKKYYGIAPELLNYITNLQEEVKFTEDYKDAYETTMIANKMLEEKYIDYKSRIDKAIEYIEKDNFNCKNQEEQIKFKTDLLDILRGEDKPQYLGYSDKECINCGRLRVEKYSDGTEICEKCNFDQNKKEYI